MQTCSEAQPDYSTLSLRWMDELVVGRWMQGQMDGWRDTWIDERTGKKKDGWMNGWTDGQTDR